MTTSNCTHTKQLYWILDINEGGWHCLGDDGTVCNKKLGFRPDLDRQHIEEKINSIAMTLHNNGYIYYSNSSDGPSQNIGTQCRLANKFDQNTITRFIIGERYSDYWYEKAIEWFNDDLIRCPECNYQTDGWRSNSPSIKNPNKRVNGYECIMCEHKFEVEE